jgi:lysine biosynthesis protein LysW
MPKSRKKCPECGAMVIIDESIKEGEMAFCEECGVGLRVVSLRPIRLKVVEEEGKDEWDGWIENIS